MPGRKSKQSRFVPSEQLVYITRTKQFTSCMMGTDGLWDVENCTFVKQSKISDAELKRIKAGIHYYAVNKGFGTHTAQKMALSFGNKTS